MTEAVRIAVFASGTGSNFDAIQQNIEDGALSAQIALVVCDRSGAKVIEKAKAKGIDVLVFSAKDHPSKAAYEQMIVEACRHHQVEWLVLAGYMRLLGPVLLGSFPNRMINIHPSLLPAFKGKDAIGQAIAYGVKVIGVSVHYVDDTMDGGKLIAQASFPVEEHWGREDIEARVHQIEHQLYPKTIQFLIDEAINTSSKTLEETK